MKRILLSGAALLVMGGLALSQINTVPQIGLITGVVSEPTYTATSVGLVPASSATDIFCINGSTSKDILIRRFLISGTAGTAITTPILINYNHSLDTGGTAYSSTVAMPVPSPMDPNDQASTSAAKAYSANPTVNDTSPVLLASISPTFAVTTTANPSTQLIFGPGVNGLGLDKSVKIPKASTVVAQVCLNLNGVSISSGTLNISAEWVER